MPARSRDQGAEVSRLEALGSRSATSGTRAGDKEQEISENDILGDAIERLEWQERSAGEASKAAQLTRRTALTGGAAGLAAALLAACGGSGGTGSASASTRSDSGSIFGISRGYRFTLVNHVTTNSCFTPTQNGAADACRLLGCSYEWTGSTSSSVSQMVSAIDAAVGAGVDGIATSLIAPGSFDQPVAAALSAGIPVVAYNSDAAGNPRLAYIGQDLLHSGREMGAHIRSLIPDGGDIMVFIATPGSGNLQPRLTGIEQVLRGTNVAVHSQASGAAESQERTTIAAFVGMQLSSYRGYFAVDGGSTAAVAQAIQTYGLDKRSVVGGGFDLSPVTQQLLEAKVIQFTIDQQLYLQGFLAILELFLHRASRGLTGAADVNTGVKLLDAKTVVPYATTTSRYEGTGTTAGVQTS